MKMRIKVKDIFKMKTLKVLKYYALENSFLGFLFLKGIKQQL